MADSGKLGADETSAKSSDLKAKALLKASVPKVVRSGEPVFLELGLHNAGSTTVEVNRYKDIGEFHIIVTDLEGNQSKLTEEGKTLFYMPSGAYRPIVLAPKMSHEWHCDLAKLFELTGGKYKVAVSVVINRGRKDAKAEVLRAKEVLFEIKRLP